MSVQDSGIGCAGLLVEDCFCGPLQSMPEEGTLTLVEQLPIHAGGCAANVALNLVRQGLQADVVGCVGRDQSGRAIRELLTSKGVGAGSIVELATVPTSRTIVLLVDGQDRRYLHMPGANREFRVEHIPRAWVATLKALYLGGLFALPGIEVGQLVDLLRFCRQRCILTVVDVVTPQSATAVQGLMELLPWIDVFLPNEHESKILTHQASPEDQLQFFGEAGVGTVVITRGGAGCIARHGGKMFRCGAYHLDTRDPSGSGDAFAAGLIASLVQNREFPMALRYASALGASATRELGTTTSVFTAAEAAAYVALHPLTVTEEL